MPERFARWNERRGRASCQSSMPSGIAAEPIVEIAPHSTTMETHCLDPLENSRWDDLVRSQPDGTFFHSSAWARVLAKTYGHIPRYAVADSSGKISALLPLMEVRSPLTGARGVCLPFTDACGPLGSDKLGAEALIRHAFEVARDRSWKHVEIRGGTPPGTGAKPAVSFFQHTLALRDGASVVRSRFEGSVRRAIQKAERSGLQLQILRSRDAVLAYYQLHCRTRQRHGLPPQSRAFFLNLHSEIMETDGGFVVLASKHSSPVAGAVFFHFNRRAIYKFGASDETQQELRGNNLVMWEAIRHLSDRGFDSLDFGRTSINNDGLRRFKQSWGTKEETIEYYKFDTATQTWATAQDRATGFHNAVFRHLPLAVNRLAGTMMYPHLD